MVLAGGRARRMNGADKAMLMLRGKTLMEHVIDRVAPQVDELLINANGDISRFAHLDHSLMSDSLDGHLGPLAGILAGFEWTKQNRPDASWLVSFACDCPLIPRDLVSRLVVAAEKSGVPVAFAASGGRRHPVFAAWSTDLPLDAREVLLARGLRKVDDLIATVPNTYVEFSEGPVDSFVNINTPDDLARAEALSGEGVRPDA